LAVPGVSPAVRQPAVRQLLVHYPTHLRRGARAWGRKVLIATFTLIGGGVEPRQNLAANAFSRRRSPLAILFSARYGFSPGLLPKSASVRRSVVGEIEEMGSPLRGRVQDSTESSGFPSANAPLALPFLGSAGSAQATHTIHLREHRQPDSVSSGIGSEYRTISNSPLSSAPR